MHYQSEFAFILPLEEEERREEIIYVDETVIPLNDVPEVQKTSKQKSPRVRTDEPSVTITETVAPNFLKFTLYVIRWYILFYLVALCAFYLVFHFALSNADKESILNALIFCDDWKQLVFFFGLYVSYAVKKVSDVSSSIPPTDKIANLLSICTKNYRTQKVIVKYVCTAIAMVFSNLSPMVRKRLFSSEVKIKAKLESDSRRIIENVEKKLLSIGSSHFMPLKWSLHVIMEAREKQDIDDRLANILITEINSLHAQCDRLIVLKHEMFSRGLTVGATTSVFCFFIVGAVRQIWTGLTGYQSYWIISASTVVHFLIFLCFLIVLRSAEQIIRPYNEEHDVFELNRILNEKLEVSAFVLDKQWDLRRRMNKMKNYELLP